MRLIQSNLRKLNSQKPNLSENLIHVDSLVWNSVPFKLMHFCFNKLNIYEFWMLIFRKYDTDPSPAWPPSNKQKFPDFSLTKFSFSLTKILWFYDLFIFSQPINDWQIPFTSSLKCTSLILQMNQIKSLNSFLAQNVLKLTTFHSSEREKKINTFKKSPLFQHFKQSSTCYNTYFGPKLWKSLTFPRLSWYLKFPWPICKFPVFSLTLKKNQISLTFPWPAATLIT